jgi:hypothetical protein
MRCSAHVLHCNLTGNLPRGAAKASTAEYYRLPCSTTTMHKSQARYECVLAVHTHAILASESSTIQQNRFNWLAV